MKPISTQQIADALGLSRVTVWKVLNGKPGVSAVTKKKVQDFLDNNQSNGHMEANPLVSANRITILASRIETSIFWTRIVDQIIGELSLRNIMVDYLPVDVMNLHTDHLCDRIAKGQTNGIIVINIYEPDTISLLSKLPYPKVFFDTVPGLHAGDLNGDLILLEGENNSRDITENFIRKGLNTIGFIGDIYYARTNLMRWNGFQAALNRHAIPLDLQFCLTGPIEKGCYRETIKQFLEKLPQLPQAFVCASDFVAFNVFSILAENPERFPQKPLLSGYDDSQEFLLEHQHITTVHVKNDLIGIRMVQQLLYRIQNPTADFEEILVFPKVLYRS